MEATNFFRLSTAMLATALMNTGAHGQAPKDAAGGGQLQVPMPTTAAEVRGPVPGNTMTPAN